MSWLDDSKVKTASEKLEEIRANNKAKAEAAQAEMMLEYLYCKVKEETGLSSVTDKDIISTFISSLQSDIDNPLVDENWEPTKYKKDKGGE